VTSWRQVVKLAFHIFQARFRNRSDYLHTWDLKPLQFSPTMMCCSEQSAISVCSSARLYNNNNPNKESQIIYLFDSMNTSTKYSRIFISKQHIKLRFLLQMGDEGHQVCERNSIRNLGGITTHFLSQVRNYAFPRLQHILRSTKSGPHGLVTRTIVNTLKKMKRSGWKS
jgi:hypothetical protein